MQWSGWLFYSLLVLWVVPGTFWGRSARALLASWTVAECFAQFAHWHTPVPVYIVLDPMVMTFIAMKPMAVRDKLIVAIYPVAWWHYPQGDAAWWTLYWLAAAQITLAGPWPQVQRSLGSFSHGALDREPKHGLR